MVENKINKTIQEFGVRINSITIEGNEAHVYIDGIVKDLKNHFERDMFICEQIQEDEDYIEGAYNFAGNEILSNEEFEYYFTNYRDEKFYHTTYIFKL